MKNWKRLEQIKEIIIERLEADYPRPVYTTTFAEECSCSRESAKEALEELHKEGKVQRRQVINCFKKAGTKWRLKDG